MSEPAAPSRYFWLWHLAALKVIEADFGPLPEHVPAESETALRLHASPPIQYTVWDQIPQAGTIFAHAALIDTGVSRAHPNLASRIDAERSIDLTSHRYGAQTEAILSASKPYSREERRSFFFDLDISTLPLTDLEVHEAEYLESMVAEYRGSKGVVRRMIDAEETFATHGTACAGLIVGEPAVIGEDGKVVPPEQLTAKATINRNANLLPYFGVDPFSKLVSIRTSFEADPHQYIAAFLYAWACKVDVIVMPRGLPDPIRAPLLPKNDLKAELESWRTRNAADLYARIGTNADPAPKDANTAQSGHLPDRPWKILRQLILAISKEIPIVCAAGNDGESQLIYPASLADDDNGIIAVGAVTAEGFRSGYSNYGDGLTVVGPSDDYEVYNRHQSRLDQSDPLIAMHDYSVGAGRMFAFCPLDLVTTDLPGVFGYDSGAAPWSSVMPGQGSTGVGGGYYTAFGGTSGASSLLGGLALLAQRARLASGKPRLKGTDLKALLQATSSTATVVAPGFRPLSCDTMNADDEHQLGVDYFFGAGLPDAAKFVESVVRAETDHS